MSDSSEIFLLNDYRLRLYRFEPKRTQEEKDEILDQKKQEREKSICLDAQLQRVGNND